MTERRFVIVHPDGRRYSVTEEGFRRLYAAQGFAVEGGETARALSGALGSNRRRPRAYAPHAFVGNPEWDCETCGRPPGHSLHAEAA